MPDQAGTTDWNRLLAPLPPRQTSEHPHVGTTELRALHLLTTAAHHTPLRQRDLPALLEITTASASALADRLIRDGYAERGLNQARPPHPVLWATTRGVSACTSLLEQAHSRIFHTLEPQARPLT